MMMNHTEKTEKPHRVTQRDVAERAGVAISSVSYVLNKGPRSVSAKTRERVLQAIQELGYRPNEYAQRLIRHNWGVDAPPRALGIILAGARNLIARPYYSTLIASMLDEAAAQEHEVRFIHPFDELQNPILFNGLINSEVISGIVLMHRPVHHEHELLRRVLDRIKNVICVDFNWPDLPSVLIDRYDVGRRVVEYLFNLGHHAIGYIGFPDERLNSYRSVMQSHGVAVQEEFVRQVEFNSPTEGWQEARALLSLPTRPTALFAASDEVAIGVLRAARELGVHVPKELSVVSVDDIEMASYVSPPLTTMQIPKSEMAAFAVRTLINQINQPYSLPINLVFPVKLIERESAAQAPH
jgi:LacI family transcriptional regulator